MANFSFFFTDTTDPGPQVGDGRPYTAAEWRMLYWLLWCQGNADRGVAPNVWNECEVTVLGANSLQVDTGLVLVHGGGRVLDTAETMAPASAPGGTSRKDSVVAQLDLDGSGEGQYEVQIYAKEGTAGAYPSMTQTANVWEVELYRYIIDDAGAITGLTDVRQWLRAATYSDHGELAGLTDDDHVAYYNAARHTKAVHDALNINADTLDGYHAADLLAGVAIGFPGGTILFGGSLGGSDGHRPIDPLSLTAREDWHWANGDLVNGVQTLDSRGKVVMASDGAAGTYPVNSTGGATTINLAHTHAGGTLSTNNAGGNHVHGTGNATTVHKHTHVVSGTTTFPIGGDIFLTGGAGISANNNLHQHTFYVTSAQDSHSHTVLGDTTTTTDHTHAVSSGATASSLSAAQSVMNPYRAWYLITYVGT